MILHCVICTAEIPEKRARNGAVTCKTACAKERHRQKVEDDRQKLEGNTCPLCCRYVPIGSKELTIVGSTRLVSGLGVGNAARFH